MKGAAALRVFRFRGEGSASFYIHTVTTLNQPVGMPLVNKQGVRQPRRGPVRRLHA
jgi:hypothetical protein